MSFRCDDCNRVPQFDRKPVRVVTQTKVVTHQQIFRDKNPFTGEVSTELRETGTGTQIVKEKSICKPCAKAQGRIEEQATV